MFWIISGVLAVFALIGAAQEKDANEAVKVIGGGVVIFLFALAIRACVTGNSGTPDVSAQNFRKVCPFAASKEECDMAVVICEAEVKTGSVPTVKVCLGKLTDIYYLPNR